MKTLLLIGMGSGNPQQITVQAIEALNRTSVFFVLDKGKTTDDLVRLRLESAGTEEAVGLLRRREGAVPLAAEALAAQLRTEAAPPKPRRRAAAQGRAGG